MSFIRPFLLIGLFCLGWPLAAQARINAIVSQYSAAEFAAGAALFAQRYPQQAASCSGVRALTACCG